MKKIIIIVEDGMVQEVLCRSKKVKIELLDLDEQNIEIWKRRNSDIKNLNSLNYTKKYF